MSTSGHIVLVRSSTLARYSVRGGTARQFPRDPPAAVCSVCRPGSARSPLPLCAVPECIEKRRLIEQRNSALRVCVDSLRTLREAVGTTHFLEFLPATADAHELVLAAQEQLEKLLKKCRLMLLKRSTISLRCRV